LFVEFLPIPGVHPLPRIGPDHGLGGLFIALSGIEEVVEQALQGFPAIADPPFLFQRINLS
jgi:hypothetical protein